MVLGVKSTTATNAGFLVGMSVVFVPVILRIFYKVKISVHTMVALAMSVAGICLLTLGGDGVSQRRIALSCMRGLLRFVHRADRKFAPAAESNRSRRYAVSFHGNLFSRCGSRSRRIQLPDFSGILERHGCYDRIGTAYCFIMQVISQQHVSGDGRGLLSRLSLFFPRSSHTSRSASGSA